MIVSKNLAHAKAPIIPDPESLAEVGGKCYTPEENEAIYLMCIASAKFMERFGQVPPQPQIDLSHYENDNKTRWYGK